MSASGELSIKLKLTNGIELEAKSDDQSGRDWIVSFAGKLYEDAKKQEEDDMIQGGYKPKKIEEVKTINR